MPLKKKHLRRLNIKDPRLNGTNKRKTKVTPPIVPASTSSHTCDSTTVVQVNAGSTNSTGSLVQTPSSSALLNVDITPSKTKTPSTPALLKVDFTPSIRKSPSTSAVEIAPLVSGSSTPKFPASAVTGRRIVDICHLWNEFRRLASHGPFDCGAAAIELESELRKGMLSVLYFKCSMCNQKFAVTTEPTDPDQGKDINFTCVKGSMSIGIGFSQFEEFMAAINIPCQSKSTYAVYHDKVALAWHQTAFSEMKKAAAEEKRLAIENADVDEDGVPFITVVVDGAWSKRSYKTKYDALSGVGVIIGYKTKKVLYMSVRNKHCTVCNKAAKNKTKAPHHHCNKNWEGPSTAMESDIISKGFMKSMEMYGLRYTTFIGDGDSSVYKTLLEVKPYGDRQIQKIGCRNHILRNYSAKLKKDMYDPKKHSQSHALRCMVKRQENRLRTAIMGAVIHHSKQQGPLVTRIQRLRDDILNSPNHIFGDHSKCDSYFCGKSPEGTCNMVPELKKSGVYEDLMNIVEQVANHAPSLIHNVDSNVAEHFNSVVAKFIGGKRINFSSGSSYTARCYGAVVSFNSRKLHSATLETAFSTDPEIYIEKLEMKREKARDDVRKRRMESRHKSAASKRRRQLKYNEYPEGDEHYGPFAEQPVIESSNSIEQRIDLLQREEILGLQEVTIIL